MSAGSVEGRGDVLRGVLYARVWRGATSSCEGIGLSRSMQPQSKGLRSRPANDGLWLGPAVPATGRKLPLNLRELTLKF